jgi:hypothetical protein
MGARRFEVTCYFALVFEFLCEVQSLNKSFAMQDECSTHDFWWEHFFPKDAIWTFPGEFATFPVTLSVFHAHAPAGAGARSDGEATRLRDAIRPMNSRGL